MSVNLIRNKGSFKILRITKNPLQLIERCGRTAYQSHDKITKDSAKKFVQMLINRGHESVLEHATITVQFDNVSRGFTHELVRHRLCSFTQESTRYVNESNFTFIFPPGLRDCETEMDGQDITDAIEKIEATYTELISKGWPAQDARQILPIGIKSQIVITANFRQWRHIFQLRTSQSAHWEIRRVMIMLLTTLRAHIVPIVFDDIVPQFTKREAEDWGWKIIQFNPEISSLGNPTCNDNAIYNISRPHCTHSI